MDFSLSTISHGAMAAATAVGGALDGVASAAETTAATAGNATATLASSIPQNVPTAVAGGASGSAHLAQGLALAEKPARAVANAIPKASWLGRAAGFLSKALPIVTIGAGAMAGAKLVSEQGAQALITTKDGRGAVLSVVGGALLLVPTPVTQLGAAAALAGVAVNQFGGFDRLNDAHLGVARVAAA